MSVFKFYVDNSLQTIDFYLEWFIEAISTLLIHMDYSDASVGSHAKLFEYGYSHIEIASSNVVLQIESFANAVDHKDIAKSAFGTHGLYSLSVISSVFDQDMVRLSEVSNMSIAHNDISSASVSTIGYTPKLLSDIQSMTLSDINDLTIMDIQANN